jgi:hypothetical protein
MSWINPLYEEHQRKRWMRPDAQQMKSSAIEVKLQAARSYESEIADWEAMGADLRRLRWMVKDLRYELAVRRLGPQVRRAVSQGQWPVCGGQAGRRPTSYAAGVS